MLFKLTFFIVTIYAGMALELEENNPDGIPKEFYRTQSGVPGGYENLTDTAERERIKTFEPQTIDENGQYGKCYFRLYLPSNANKATLQEYLCMKMNKKYQPRLSTLNMISIRIGVHAKSLQLKKSCSFDQIELNQKICKIEAYKLGMPNNTSANYPNLSQHGLSLIQIQKQMLCFIVYILVGIMSIAASIFTLVTIDTLLLASA
uniref:Uncharacterized protein n=1 Tax=Romanomermis culicivorax TaxID=13658 RepID=A0A915J3H1_ROMCU